MNTQVTLVPTAGPERGAHVLAEADGGRPEVVLVADGSGSQAQVALAARELLQGEGIATRVVRLTSVERFRAQSQAYRDTVLPPEVRARVSVAAGTALGWYAMLGEARLGVGLHQFGARAPHRSLHRQFGLSPERVAAAARSSLQRAK